VFGEREREREGRGLTQRGRLEGQRNVVGESLNKSGRRELQASRSLSRRCVWREKGESISSSGLVMLCFAKI
jgi:hypothetical protein